MAKKIQVVNVENNSVDVTFSTKRDKYAATSTVVTVTLDFTDTSRERILDLASASEVINVQRTMRNGSEPLSAWDGRTLAVGGRKKRTKKVPTLAETAVEKIERGEQPTPEEATALAAIYKKAGIKI